MRQAESYEPARSERVAFHPDSIASKQRRMIASPVPPSGHFEGHLHKFAVRVYHEDTDASGLVYHGSYLRWFERARSDILALIGIDQRAAMESGAGFYVVSDMAIRYQAPARLGDAVVVETTCDQTRAASARMTQTAFKDGERLCEAKRQGRLRRTDGQSRCGSRTAWRRAFAAIALQ